MLLLVLSWGVLVVGPVVELVVEDTVLVVGFTVVDVELSLVVVEVVLVVGL